MAEKVAKKVEEKKEKKPEAKKKLALVAEEKKEPKAKEAVKFERPKASKEELIEASELFMHPLISEKAIGMIERENKISFIVRKHATKTSVKDAFEKLYEARVVKVNIVKDMKGRKKAIVKVGREAKADAIATKLGMI